MSRERTWRTSCWNKAVSADVIADFYRQHHVRKLSLFGSVLRDDFRPECDVDVLVEFRPEDVPDFFDLIGVVVNSPLSGNVWAVGRACAWTRPVGATWFRLGSARAWDP